MLTDKTSNRLQTTQA